MNALYKATISIAFLLTLSSCGGAGSDSLYCVPNYTQGAIAFKVTYVIGSMNTYEFEVCYNRAYIGQQVTVYGHETFGDIATMNPSADFRLPHLVDGLYPGDRFEVQFNNNDTWFTIYADDNNGAYSTTTQLIRGEFR